MKVPKSRVLKYALLMASYFFATPAKADGCDLAIKLSKQKQYFHAHLVLRMGASDGSQKAWAKSIRDCLIGSRTVRDMAGLAIWLQHAADQGDTDALLQLAFIYVDAEGVPKDVARAKALIALAESKGNESAEFFRPILEKMTEEK